jgi:hypothetical protein
MSFRKIAVAAACMTVLSVAGAQAATHRHHTMHHRGPVAAGADLAAGAVGAAGAVAAGAIGTADAFASAATAPFGGPYAGPGGYYAPSAWGDYECSPGYAGCRPYAAKDWRR